MADTSPLVNLDLINKIYKTINAQINERVYDPQWNSEATLGSSTNKYKSAYVSGDVSTGTLNSLTLTADKIGFAISGGTTTPKTLTVADTVKINKSFTVGADNTGTVTIKSGGGGNTAIIGPSGGIVTFAPPTGATTATAGTITITGADGTTPTVFATKGYVDDYLGDVETLLAAI